MWQWYKILFSKKIEEIEVQNPSSLFDVLAKAKEDALNPELPAGYEKYVDNVVNVIFPEEFKKALMGKKSLVFISRRDFDPNGKFTEEDWIKIKFSSIKELNRNAIPAKTSSSDDMIMVELREVLAAIKDYKPTAPQKEKEFPLHQQGIYR